MEFITVHTTLNGTEAELMRSQLESAGFVVNLKNEDRVLGIETSGGIQVQVHAEDEAEARALLDYKAPAGA